MANNLSLQQYKELIETQINQATQKLEQQAQSSLTPDSMPGWYSELDSLLKDYLKDGSDNPPLASSLLIHPPKNLSLDWLPDYALPMFEIAKITSRSPNDLASSFASTLNAADLFDKVEASGPYINFRLKDSVLFEDLKNIVSSKDTLGRLSKNGEVIVIDYSSPNVAKPFGINHLSSTVIGEALSRLLEARGYTVIRDNHIGNWGTQFGNLLAAYETYAAERNFNELTLDDLTELYVRFNQEKKASPELVRLGQTCFAKLEAGDPDLLDKWMHAVDLSLNEFNAMYQKLNITFDTQIGESYFNESSKQIVDNLPKDQLKDIVVYDESSKAVYIKAEHPVMLRTSNGYYVYAARDLATLDFRIKAFDPSYILYVVGEEQASYFRSIFELVSKAELNKRSTGQPVKLEHIGFGLILDKDGKKLSTRKGTSGKLEDVINAVDSKAVTETKKRNPDLSDTEVEKIAQKVAIGAITWNELKTDRVSSVRFDIDSMLELGGGSVIDVLYTYSRTASILKKLNHKEESLTTDFPPAFSSDIEHQLAVRLGELQEVIKRASEHRQPHLLVNYLQELSQLHGRFYEESRVIGISDNQLANLRVALHRAYKVIIENGLNLLNIPITEKL